MRRLPITLLTVLVLFCPTFSWDKLSSTDIPNGPDGKPPYKVCEHDVPQPCVQAPKMLHSPMPKYSKEARKSKIEGVGVYCLVVGIDGLAYWVGVKQKMGHGLDEEAVKTLKKWKFEAAVLNGKTVPVQINVEVNFRLN